MFWWNSHKNINPSSISITTISTIFLVFVLKHVKLSLKAQILSPHPSSHPPSIRPVMCTYVTGCPVHLASERVSPFKWTLYHPLLCHGICSSTLPLFLDISVLQFSSSAFFFLFSFLHAGQSPRFCSAYLPPPLLSFALSPPSPPAVPLVHLSLPFHLLIMPWLRCGGRLFLSSRRLSLPMFPTRPPVYQIFFRQNPPISTSASLPFSLFPFLHHFRPAPSYTHHLFTKLSIPPFIPSFSQLLFPSSSQPVQTLQRWDQNVGQIEHEPR